MKAVAFDTETKGFDWWDPEQQAFLATWSDADGAYAADLSDPAQVGRFITAIQDADIVIGHNIKFDVHQVRATLGFDPIAGKQIADTDTMSRLLYPEGASGSGFGHGLKPLATIHLNADAADPEDAIKDMAKQIGLKTIKQTGAYYEIYRAYPSVMTEYARMDARYTYDLWAKWIPLIEADDKLSKLFHLEMEVIRRLTEAEEYGIATDQARCAELKRTYEAERRECYDRCAKELGDDALGGPGSSSALVEALLSIGVPLTETTDNGELATNKYALQPFAKDFPVIEDLFELRRLERFLSTYIGAIEGRDVIHTSFQPIGAWTGRMSCRSPNMQNFPKRAGKEVRSVLVPRSGSAFVVCDFESIEIRLLAYYLGNHEFRQLVVERDSHAWMASQIWGGSPDDYAKGGPNESLRSLAKNMLFAITYGAGAPRIQAMLLDAGMDVSKERAKEIIAVIKNSLPGYRKLMKRIRAKIETHGYVNTILGRKNPVNREKAYVGLNAIIQGSAADIMKLAVVALCQEAEKYEGRFVLVVHDEAVVEVPTDQAPACLRAVGRAMTECIDIDPPLSVSGDFTTVSYADA